MNHKGKGMSRETFEHIENNLHLLELDVEKGVILNRNANSTNGRGYKHIKLKGKHITQHQVFAVARWGKDCIGMTVNHINENKLDNSWNNLELMTLSDNIKAKSKQGTEQLIKVRNIETGDIMFFDSQRQASRELGLFQSNISSVINGKLKQYNGYHFECVS